MKIKLVFITIIGCLAFGVVHSQTLDRAEYYFNSDPGVGNGIPVTLAPAGDDITQEFNFDVTGLNPGFHRLFIRVQDDLGRWSIVKGHLFAVYDETHIDLTKTQPAIVGYEYFFDKDNGVGTGTWVGITHGDDITENFDFSTSGLQAGYHRLYIRPKDAAGKWGNYMIHRFYLFEDTLPDLTRVSSKIVAAEYFFDKDSVPSGQGVPLTITPGNEVEWNGTISVEGMNAGKHFLFIRVKDSIGTWSIAASEGFNVVNLLTESNSPVCPGTNEGWAKVTIDGGIPPFTYLWDDEFQQKTDSAFGLAPGTYTVTVTDANGAILKETIEIEQYDPIVIGITTDDTDCNEAQGSATATVESGGFPPYKYSWTTGSDINSITKLRSGIYYVTVTDNAKCSNTAIATINDQNGPQITVNEIQHLDCAGDANGYIDVGITGGSGGYTRQWSNGETTEDITNLSAGPYEITVYDDQLCRASKSIVVEEPDPLTFSLSVLPSDCNSTTGSATVSVFGGTAPYGYTWEGGGLDATKENLAAGVYSVTVTDSKFCEAEVRVAVSDKDAPIVSVYEIIESTCGLEDGEIRINASGGATGVYTFNWKKEGIVVGTDQNLTGVGPGYYSVSVQDGTCKTLTTAVIPAELPPTDPICLVTVDTVTRKNLIVWNKTPGEGIVSYNIYRETSQAGVFNLIKNQPYDSLSQYTDEFADPVVRSWRYKISSVDECGNESRLSGYHKTMHLTLNLAVGGGVNLIWNHYEGFIPFDNQYNIWRLGNGSWDHLTSIPSTDNTYTDLDPPIGWIYYFVEAVHPTGCTPTQFKAGTLNSSRSNRQSRLKTGVQEEINEQYSLMIYPNPSSGKFTLAMDLLESENVDIRVYDITGKLVYVSTFDNYTDKLEAEVDMTGYSKGIYHLNVKTDTEIFNDALIIE